MAEDFLDIQGGYYYVLNVTQARLWYSFVEPGLNKILLPTIT